jgi:Glycosyl hydrolase family 71./F5/8 type C domain.
MSRRGVPLSAIGLSIAIAAAALSFASCSSVSAQKAGEGAAIKGPLDDARSQLAVKKSARPAKRPLVLAHYMPWYSAPPVSSGYGFHWHQGGAVFDPFVTLPDGRANIASTYYPLTGPYDSRDLNALEYQAALMKMGGLDGVIFDWYGIDDALDYKQVQDSTLAMIDVLKRAGLKFAICYEDQSVGKMVEAKKYAKADAVSVAKRTFAWMQEHWFGDEAYAKIDGRPVLLCFGPQYFKTKAEWDEIFSAASPRPYFVCLDDQGGTMADASYDWMPMWASEGGVLSPTKLVSYLNAFYAKRASSKHLVATAFPGFADIYQKAGSGVSYGYLNYAKGETFKLTVDAAMKTNPDILQIATWNDYGEGTVIEPTIEHGYAELEYLQDLRRQFDSSFPYDYSDLRAPIELFKAKVAASSTDALGDADRAARIETAYSAIYSGDAKAYRKALKAAKIQTDFGVSPLLRDPSASAKKDAAKAAFDPAGRKNLALGMPVVYSSNIYAFTGAKAVDGDVSSYWEGAASSYPDSISVDLLSSQKLSTLVLKLNPKQIWGARTERIAVLSSDDGESYSTVVPEADYGFDPVANGNCVAIPLGLSARYVKLVITANSGAGAAQIAELEVYGE